MLQCAYDRTFTRPIRSPSPIVDQGRYQRTPASLMRCAQTGAIVSVVELVEQNKIPPVWILLEFGCPSIDRTFSTFIAREDTDHAVGNLTPYLVKIQFFS